MEAGTSLLTQTLNSFSEYKSNSLDNMASTFYYKIPYFIYYRLVVLN